MAETKEQFQNIIKFILYKSRECNNPITYSLAELICQTIVNPSTRNFFIEQQFLTNEEVEYLKEQAIKKVDKLEDISIQTLQLQLNYNNSYFDYELQRQERIKNQSIETGKLIDQICLMEIKNSKDQNGLSSLYKKLFSYLLYKNKEIMDDDESKDDSEQQKNIRNFNIEKEVAAALESIIPRAALGPFVSLNPSEKVTQLIELSSLVIGIRLFNKDIGKGGQSLISIDDLINNKFRGIYDILNNESVEIVEKCDDYCEINEQEFEKYKDELIYLRQYLQYLLTLKDDIEVSEDTIQTNDQRYKKEIAELSNLLGNKASAPKEQVYPKFAALSQTYVKLYEEKKMYEIRSNQFDILKQSIKQICLTLPKDKIVKAQNRQKELMNQTILDDFNEEAYSDHIERLLPNETPNFMSTQLDLQGLCAYSLYKNRGLLLPMNISLGIIKYKEKCYVFKDLQSMKQFCQQPDEILDEINQICKEKPELIQLLRIEDQFEYLFKQDKQGILKGQKQQLMVDKSTETPVHFISKNFDANYFWNEWELRKQAIQMANIRKKQTKACQTILSHFYTNSDAQVWPLKDAETNTGINKGIIPERPRNYYVGLRDKNVK